MSNHQRPTDEDLRRLVARAHVHDDHCYGFYEPCGEHHRHDACCFLVLRKQLMARRQT